jgi:glutathione S-transferase
MRTFAKDPDPAVLQEFRKRAEGAWGVLDAHLAARRYVVADRLTIADLSLCGYVFWPEEIGVDWARYPNVHAWIERLRAEPRWTHPYALLPGHPRPESP